MNGQKKLYYSTNGQIFLGFRMYYLFFILLFAVRVNASQEEFIEKPIPLANIDAASALVGGCVNAITGDYLERVQDISIEGPEALVFERFYASSDHTACSLQAGWRHNHHGLAHVNVGKTDVNKKHHHYVFLGDFLELSGRCCRYYYESEKSAHTPEEVKIPLDWSLSKVGLTNCSVQEISGRTNPKNTILIHKPKEKTLQGLDGAGNRSIFSKQDNRWKLTELQKPNGFCFKYNDEAIQLVNTQTGRVLSWLQLDQQTEVLKDKRQFSLKANDGRLVTYKVSKTADKEHGKQSKEFRYYINEVSGLHIPTITYDYVERQKASGQQICRRSDAQGKYLIIEYYTKNDVSKDDFRLDRVKRLLAPLGSNQEPVVLYRFDYDATIEEGRVLNGYTTVYDAYNHKTVYEYDRSHRLLKIIKYSGPNPYITEQFTWGQGKDKGNLTAKAFLDGQGNLLKQISYIYDDAGNILQETLYGNLTGNGFEEYHRYFSYTTDGLNLPLSMEEDNGYGERYSYQPGTDRRVRKFVTDHGQVRIRHFYEYNPDGLLAKTTVDNGTGTDLWDFTNVTERRMTYLAHTESMPIGLPNVIEERYLDHDGEKLLKRINKTFSKEGYVLSEEHIDGNGNSRYTKYYVYDAHGNPIRETNALGYVTEYTYSPTDQLLSVKTEKNLLQKSYDPFGRVIRTEDHDLTDGSVLISHHSFDYLSNRTATTDPYGHVTQYGYDDLSRQTWTIFPAIPNEHGNLVPTANDKQYNEFDSVIQATDQANCPTKIMRNAYGKPTQILHPDGTNERFVYNRDGTLAEMRARAGLITRYTYDFLGRETQKAEYAPDGTLLSCASATYNAFHITSKTAADGRVTSFTYDRAGRLIQLTSDNHKTTYEYDEFNRRAKTYEWYEQGYRLTHKQYDFLDRITEELVTGNSGTLLSKDNYTYDTDSNVIAHTKWTETGPATEYATYNGRKQPTKKTDPNGAVTHYHYNHQAKNIYGQTILEVTETDPLGYRTCTSYNALKQPGCIRKYNPLGQLISQCEMFYSGTGPLQVSIDKCLSPNEPEKNIVTRRSYDSMDNLVELIEAEKTPDQQRTSYKYNPYGQKESVCLPNGTVQQYIYDPKGRIHTWFSQDFSYTYQYDSEDRIVAVTDNLRNETTKRTYNYGQLVEELLANGLKISYAYDQLQRPIKVIYPDNSYADYHYNGLNLISVERKNADRTSKYQFSYTYERPGLPASLTNNIHGIKTTFEYDLCGRPKKIALDHITQEVANYDLIGNKVNTNREAPFLFRTNYFYDDLQQLKKEEGPISHTYQYDSLFNCLSKDNQPKTYNLRNQLLTVGSINFNHNPLGALEKRSDNNIEYHHDSLGRLTEVVQGDQRWIYVYDAFHRRLSKQSQQKQNDQWQTLSEELYLYQGQNEIGTCKSDGTIISYRLLGTSRAAEIGATLAIELQNEIYVPFHDLQGNIIALFDKDGKVVESSQFSAFGEETTSQAPINPWRYASKRHDPETGFIYFGRRHYDPSTIRWTSPDPAGFADGINLYQFLHNNPFSQIDPYGEIPFLLALAVPIFTCTFEGVITFTSVCTIAKIVAGSLIGATAGHIVYKLNKKYSYDPSSDKIYNRDVFSSTVEKENEQKENTEKKAPPYSGKELGNDPTKSPGEGFEWRGKGEAGSKEGSWYNPQTDESLRSDFNHGPPIQPHWDYENSNEEEARLFLDGSYEWKGKNER